MAPPRAQEQRVRTFAQRILFRHLSKQQAEGLLERLSFGRRLGQHRTRRKTPTGAAVFQVGWVPGLLRAGRLTT